MHQQRPNMSGSIYDSLMKQIFYYIQQFGLTGPHMRDWTEEDPQLMLTDHEGMYTIANYEELVPRPEGRYAALLMVPAGEHESVANEEPLRLVVQFDYDDSPSRIPGMSNRALLIRTIYLNGEKTSPVRMQTSVYDNEELLRAFKERAVEVFRYSLPLNELLKSTRWVVVATLPGATYGLHYWTGQPSTPWTHDVKDAYLFTVERDAQLMSEILILQKSRIITPPHAESVISHESIQVPTLSMNPNLH